MTADQLDLLRCPRTGSRLMQQGENLVSEQDGHVYPIVLGIPDFRLFDPPYMSREQERKSAERLHSAQDKSYAELVDYFERTLLGDNRKPQIIEKGITHRLKLRERSPNRLQQLLDTAGLAKVEGRVLDLGCGSGEAIGALLAKKGGSVIGMDISLTELVLAKKLLAEQGITAFLVAGCAEAMPFQAQCFDFIYSPDVIEHVSDQNDYLSEIQRILTADGRALLNSPNRYSVVCPELHVGIWFLTFLPRPLIDPVCRLLGKGPYVGKRLVSLTELKRLLKRYFAKVQIFSRSANANAQSLSGRLFYWLSPWSERLFSYIADQHVVLVRK